ncbi:hypothetical protein CAUPRSCDRAFT_12117 [Caulochytrium protostelioides]|uniref:Uncharacterized protein n=1 Tax=Caulochytrium protostelioides TaxID=1555241 RepID=A0A4P9WXK5_9FUNG|nr:hypothetical protein CAUPRSCDRAFT_12117 [Caulochytrium protostelioides]
MITRGRDGLRLILLLVFLMCLVVTAIPTSFQDAMSSKTLDQQSIEYEVATVRPLKKYYSYLNSVYSDPDYCYLAPTSICEPFHKYRLLLINLFVEWFKIKSTREQYLSNRFALQLIWFFVFLSLRVTHKDTPLSVEGQITTRGVLQQTEQHLRKNIMAAHGLSFEADESEGDQPPRVLLELMIEQLRSDYFSCVLNNYRSSLTADALVTYLSNALSEDLAQLRIRDEPKAQIVHEILTKSGLRYLKIHAGKILENVVAELNTSKREFQIEHLFYDGFNIEI